ncbi:aldose 1-epimerase [Anseongella ginsenosidimutans]|uniref:Aldose 1-epimerase n=1 Tax=Anseongella ginsenosidimutans TaxID=496056 RepID=A0A4R3KUR1_9SPHI|nr:aldose epimerase family protein [Anseongella ginsenosidimutans]QEC51798.1 galactose mutarotase [Anseongella ginsenosidimutans]TCS89169.1 aldose 1-epimerase [Anseongella ginsenosidimutans]
MSVIKENSNLAIDGKTLCLIRLDNGRQTSLIMSNYGCLVLSWTVKDKRGEPCDIVLGFDNLENYLEKDYLENYPYFGVLVGRYANRIKDARFTLDGELYRLPANKGKDHLHGGFRGFDKAVWDVLEIDEVNNRVVFAYTSPAGEEGYPGNLEVQVSYTLTEDNKLVQEIRARTDQATPLNLTHHDYFNLNNGRGQINDHLLEIPADAYLEQDANLVVNGNLVPVENTWHDFRKEKKVGLDLSRVGEYDQSFVLNKRSGDLSLAATLRSADTGLCLRVYTTEPVCHLYTGKWIPGIKGKGGQQYGPFSGLCLEVQGHPNAVNIPAFPATVLRPGETYRQASSYEISVEAESAR